jgi:hypothetical protein
VNRLAAAGWTGRQSPKVVGVAGRADTWNDLELHNMRG